MLTWACVSSETADVESRSTGAWADLARLVTTPSVRPHKSGPGWMPSDTPVGPRGGARVSHWCVLVLDIEGPAVKVKGEVKRLTGEPAPSLQTAAAELKERGWAAALATSHSHEEPAETGTLGPRYRIVLPVTRPVLSAEIRPLALLVAAGLGLVDCLDMKCLEPARLFYLPSHPIDRHALAESVILDGDPVDVDALLIHASASQVTAVAHAKSATDGVIGAFNDQADFGTILEGNGYIPKGRNRWLFPGSTSGLPGVAKLPGVERIFSHHGGDPLANEHSHDAFSAWTVLEHGGDQGRALVAAATLLGFDRNSPATLPNGSSMPALEFDRVNRARASRHNLHLALAEPGLCATLIRYDTFHDALYLAPPGTEAWRALTDNDVHGVAMALESGPARFRDIPTDRMRQALSHAGDSWKFDSAQHWLGGLKWDGVERIEMFLHLYFGADDSPYTRAVSLYLWTALAGRVQEPGCKADMVPVAVGEQGAGKSTAIGALVPASDFFIELDLSANDDDLARMLRGKLVAELGELRGLRKKEMDALKSFVTRTHEQWVPKFKEMATRYARRSVLFGSTNRQEFLMDDTGNRRWLPFNAGRCDAGAIARDREQLWAEAADRFFLMGVMWQDAQRLANEMHTEFIEVDPWQKAAADWLGTVIEPVTPEQVLAGALNMVARDFNKSNKDRMGAVLRGLGLEPGRAWVNGRQIRVYRHETNHQGGVVHSVNSHAQQEGADLFS